MTTQQFGQKGWTPERIGSLVGKTYVITGANSGAGHHDPQQQGKPLAPGVGSTEDRERAAQAGQRPAARGDAAHAGDDEHGGGRCQPRRRPRPGRHKPNYKYQDNGPQSVRWKGRGIL